MTAADRMNFSVIVRNSDYIVRDHQVFGVSIMPGVTYIDILFRYLEMKGFALACCELRHVLFVEPVATTPTTDRKLFFELVRHNNYWAATARSQEMKGGIVDEHSPLTVHFECKVYEREPDAPVYVDIARLTREALTSADMDDAYAYNRMADIQHYSFMKTAGTVHQGEDFLLADLSLSPLARQYVDEFLLHPAFLDSASIVPALFLKKKPDGGKAEMTSSVTGSSTFIPIYVDSVQVTGKLGDVCYVHVRENRDMYKQSPDIAYLNLDLLNKEGKLIARLTKFGCKNVRHQQLIRKLEGAETPARDDKPASVPAQAGLAGRTDQQFIAVVAIADKGSGSGTVAAAKLGDAGRKLIEQDLMQLLADMSGTSVTAMNPDTSFYEVGLDSRQLLSFADRLEEKLGKELYPTLLFEYTTAAGLSAFLFEEYGDVYQVTASAAGAQANAGHSAALPAMRAAQPIPEQAKVVQTAGFGEQGRLAIERDMRVLLAEMSGCSPEAIDPDTSFYELGLDSRQLLTFVDRLEEKLGKDLYPTLLFEYTTASGLSSYLYEEYGAEYPGVQLVQPVQQPVNPSHNEVQPAPTRPAAASLSKEMRIRRDIQKIIASMLGIEAEQVNAEQSFYEQGLDSRQLLTFVDMLEEKLGSELYPTLLFEYTSIEGLAGYLLEAYPDRYPFLDGEETHPPAWTEPSPLPIQSQPAQKPEPLPVQQTVHSPVNVDEGLLYFDTQWQPVPLVQGEGTGRTVLLFEDGGPHWDEMAQQLKERSVAVLFVRPGASFEATDDTYTIRPDVYSDYEQLLESLISSGRYPDTVVHGWSTSKHRDVSGQMDAGVRSIFRFVKSLDRWREGSRLHLVYVFESTSDTGCPAYEAVGGLLKSVKLEIRDIAVKTVEVDVKDGSIPVELARMLVDEAGSIVPEQVHIRLASGVRLVKRLVPPRKAAGQAADEIKVREGGVYLITGGLGALGRITAHHLSKQAKLQLVLAGRTPLSETIRSELNALERNGCRAAYVQGDVTDRLDAGRLIQEVKRQFGTITGVIHSAGVVMDNLLARKTEQETEQVFAPKVFGTMNLDKALGDEPIDFFIVYSSLAAVSGNAGQSDYAYGNAFQDSFSAAREVLRSRGERVGRTLSINWPFWQDGGMHMAPRMKEMLSRTTGMLPLPTDSGVQALDHMLRIPGHSLGVIFGQTAKISSMLGLADRIDEAASPAAEYPVFLEPLEDQIEATRVYIKLLGPNRRIAQRYLLRTASSALTEVMVFGEGPPLLLIPAFGYTAPQWNNQIEAWSSRHRLIVFHPPGSGLSLGGDDVAYETVCQGLAEALDALGVQEPVPVLASSWGGMVAMSFASLYPERVQSLVLGGCFYSVSLEESTMLKDWLKTDFEHVGASDLYDDVFQTQFMSSAVAKYATAQMFPNGIASTETYLPGIQAPVCMIAGEEDQVFSQSRTEELLSLLPTASLQVIPGAGHFPHCTHAEQYNRIAMSFVEICKSSTIAPIAVGQSG